MSVKNMVHFLKVVMAGLLLLSGTFVYAQTSIPVCGQTASDQFALFASNEGFTDMHPVPVHLEHRSLAGGRDIIIKCPDGKDANGYFIKAKEQTDHWIFVFHEWWGLNDYIKREAERLYDSVGNVNVLALDMYDGKVADTREKARAYMQGFSQERGNAIVSGALHLAGAQAKISTIGWCFGGGQSMQAALAAGKQAVGCVIYYGMPEGNPDRLMALQCDVLFIWGNQDRWINAEVVSTFRSNMLMAGKGLFVREFEADHAFANPSNPKHNRAFAERAFGQSVDYVKARLK